MSNTAGSAYLSDSSSPVAYRAGHSRVNTSEAAADTGRFARRRGTDLTLDCILEPQPALFNLNLISNERDAGKVSPSPKFKPADRWLAVYRSSC